MHSSEKLNNNQLRMNYETYFNQMDCKMVGCSSQQLPQHWHCQLCQREITDPNEMDTHMCHKMQSCDSINNNKRKKPENAAVHDASPKRIIAEENHSNEFQSEHKESSFSANQHDSYDASDKSSAWISPDKSVKFELSGNIRKAASTSSFEDEKISGNFLLLLLLIVNMILMLMDE